ncbi:hypothetical protein HHI36_012812 [Cryptolaemus montrouzieri]|uniref:Uncharacterized protein n=1 Tax=Cryptolaemus montrouzieri TaxID=559131 RepID=A0ABD2NGR7_9CUCU
MRSTRDGRLLIRLPRDEDYAENVRKALRQKGGLKRKQIGGNKKLVAMVKKEEVEEALWQALKCEKDGGYSIGNLRPMAYNMMAVKLTMDKEKGDSLLHRDKRIRVGPLRGRLEKRFDVDNFFKCWGSAHVLKNCKGQDRTGLCYKCGKIGSPG